MAKLLITINKKYILLQGTSKTGLPVRLGD